MLLEAIGAGLDIICGLHYFLSEGPDLHCGRSQVGSATSSTYGSLRQAPVAEATPHRQGCTVVTMVGSDCAVGKMSAALDIEAEARRRTSTCSLWPRDRRA